MNQHKVWSKALSQTGVEYVGNNPHADLTVSKGAYVAGPYLQHYWEMAHKLDDYGFDYAVTASGRVNCNSPPNVLERYVFREAPGLTGNPI